MSRIYIDESLIRQQLKKDKDFSNVPDVPGIVIECKYFDEIIAIVEENPKRKYPIKIICLDDCEGIKTVEHF